jgi:hypothetical protein
MAAMTPHNMALERPVGVVRSSSPETVVTSTFRRFAISHSRTMSSMRRISRSTLYASTAWTSPDSIPRSSRSNWGRGRCLVALVSFSSRTQAGSISQPFAAARWRQASSWRSTPRPSPALSLEIRR